MLHVTLLQLKQQLEHEQQAAAAAADTSAAAAANFNSDIEILQASAVAAARNVTCMFDCHVTLFFRPARRSCWSCLQRRSMMQRWAGRGGSSCRRSARACVS